MNVDLDQFKQGSFVTVAGTFVGYGLILLVMFLVLFVVPFLLFSL